MPTNPATVSSLSLIGCGFAVCCFAGKSLTQEPSLRLPPNPLGIKASPYGEVIAMAIQGPIDLYWHAGSDCHDPDCHDPDCDHDHDHHDAADCDHGPECDHDHRSADPTLATSAQRPAPRTLRDQYRAFLESIDAAANSRTNPRSASAAHKFYLRRKIEDKLRFAWQLDPGHYGNYSSYHFFLTEPSVGTRPELTQGAQKLADATIAYGLNTSSGDARPALTAAAAAQNVLELMFSEPRVYPTRRMRDQLALVDHCLAIYQQRFDESLSSGQWNLLSPLRQEETTERYRFLNRVRDAADATIRRLEGRPAIQQAASH